jgi:hypothetical protein
MHIHAYKTCTYMYTYIAPWRHHGGTSSINLAVHTYTYINSVCVCVCVCVCTHVFIHVVHMYSYTHTHTHTHTHTVCVCDRGSWRFNIPCMHPYIHTFDRTRFHENHHDDNESKQEMINVLPPNLQASLDRMCSLYLAFILNLASSARCAHGLWAGCC